MRALVILGVALSCAFGCGGDDAPAPASPTGEGGEASGGDARPGAGASTEAGAVSNGGAGGGAAGAGMEPNVAGGSGEAGAAGSGPPVVSVGIVAEATHFLDYGKLRIGFEQAIDAATLTITLSPLLPAKLVVTGTSQVDETTVDVTLAYYHLPRDYQLSVSGNLQDATPFEAGAEISGLNNGARAAFLSQQSGSGAFSSWPDVAPNATPLEAADSVCQREADAAGLRGTFQAFLSIDGSVDAGCRALGLDAKLADNCGEAAMPVDDAPLLSMDGLPIVEGATDIIANRWAVPISFHADGTPATPSYTWNGSVSGAKAFPNIDCSGWTQTTGNGLPSNLVGQRLLEYEFSRSCDTVASLLCLQTSGMFFGPSTLHKTSGKRAFVSKGKLFGTMSFDGQTGIDAADALCQSEALAASLDNFVKFRAYLGTVADTDALCYVLGRTGRVVDNCGLPNLPDTDPWRRVDDYPIGSAAELAAGALRAPLALAADSTLMTNERPRTGSERDGTTTWTCNDWSGTTFYSLSGHPGYITPNWASHWTTDCESEETSVYCFEN